MGQVFFLVKIITLMSVIPLSQKKIEKEKLRGRNEGGRIRSGKEGKKN